MPKFQMLRDLLVRDRIITESQLYQPGAPPPEWLEHVHDTHNVQA